SEDNERLCSSDLPFAATYVPSGFASEPVEGPGGGATVPNATVVHFEGPRGMFIDVFRGTNRYTIGTARQITVLGSRAQIGAIEDGYAVDFTFGTPVFCNRFHVEGFGLVEQEVQRFAEGLTAG
ncbi:MAG: hypothetical protein ACREQY_15255, partial [Candidatus Binatia bacterium]